MLFIKVLKTIFPVTDKSNWYIVSVLGQTKVRLCL